MFGKSGKPEIIKTPDPAPNQMLVRIDSVGICYSDVKLINQGNQHPKIRGRNLSTDPTRPGHEVSFTVILVGENLKDNYQPGDRFTIQPEVVIANQKQTYGFSFPGGLTQYQLIGPELLETDQGVSLLKLEGVMGFSAVSLLEPWGSVLAAYDEKRRLIPKKGGNMWIIGTPLLSGKYDFSQYLDLPGLILISDLDKDLENIIRNNSRSVTRKDGIKLDDYENLVHDETNGQGFDDIILLDSQSARQVEKLITLVNRGGLINLVGTRPLEEEAIIDPQRIHYDFISLVGTTEQEISTSYGVEKNRSELKERGTVIFLGGGGPIGQMHLQRAIMRKNGPTTILVSEINQERITFLTNRFSAQAQSLKKNLIVFNPEEHGSDLRKCINKIVGGAEVDDVVVLAPTAEVINQAACLVQDDSLINLFAGTPAGICMAIDLSKVYLGNLQITGASGLSFKNIQEAYHLALNEEIDLNAAVAAVGGMMAAQEAIQATQERRYPGRIIIYPQLEDLPLLSMSDLVGRYPLLETLLGQRDLWTREAEAKLFELEDV